MTGTKKQNKEKTSNGANLGFEKKLWKVADKLRNNMDAAEYKHVVLGLIFLKYISDAFSELYQKLANTEGADPEDSDEYRAENIFYVPKKARWGYLQKNAKQSTIGKLCSASRNILKALMFLPKSMETPSKMFAEVLTQP